MKSKIRKIGNSVGVTIPSELAKECFLSNGDQVDISVLDGAIIVKKLLPKVPVIPSTLVEEMTYEELKNELTTGFELSSQIVQSGRNDLITASVNRANDVLEEFNRRIDSDE